MTANLESRSARRNFEPSLRRPNLHGDNVTNTTSVTADHSAGPLTGVRVIDCSTVLAGPLCAQVLGDYGAEVIKIEHPQRPDAFRTHGPQKGEIGLWWKIVSRNKRCITLDLSQPRGAELFCDLAATADVIVENFRPGTLDRWGIGYETLRGINPKIVLASITGFGQTGPYRSRPGFGTLAEAMSGFAAITGLADGPPTLPSMGLADSICGITGVGAIMMALWNRDRVGGTETGQHLDLSLLAPMLTAVGPGPTAYDQLATLQQRNGNRSTSNAPRNTYLTSDQRWLAVSTSSTSIARRVMHLVGRDDLAEQSWFESAAGRAAHVDELDDAVASWMSERTAQEVTLAFEQADAAVAPVYDAADVVADPHICETQMVTSVHDEDLGAMRMVGLLFGMSHTPGSIRHTGRDFGVDTDDVLDELGVSVDEREQLRVSKVI